jgi:hypothetical protein
MLHQNPERTKGREETSGETARQPRHKEPRLPGAATSWKREEIRRDLQEGSRTGDNEANSRIFRQDAESERQDIAEGSAPSETEKEPAHRVGTGNVGVPATVGSFPHKSDKQDDGDKPGRTGTLSGSRSGHADLRTEQRERLESKRHEKPKNHGKEGDADHRHHKHSPGERRNGGTPVCGSSGQIALRREQCDVYTHC